MKKIVKILIITIIICMAQYCQVFAASNVNINLVSNDSVKVGDEITITITGGGDGEGINGWQGKINYDSNVLEYVNKKSEKEGWSVTGYNQSTGIFLAEVINVLDNNTFEKNKENPILSFTFKVKDTTVSDTTVTVSDIVASPTNLEVTNNSLSKKITIAKDGNQSNNGSDNYNSSNSSSSSNNANMPNNYANKQDGSTSQKPLPDAGLNTVIMLVFTSVIILIGSYIGYKKYEDIR